MTARQKLISKIKNMKSGLILSCLEDMAKPWDRRTEEERAARAYMLDELERRMNNEDRFDCFLDKLEELEESKR
tara:strand:- start:267 stop:488 length:222 start_codon:yes stop_codon:yes gene_type:complete